MKISEIKTDGSLYNAFDEELSKLRNTCKDLCYEFNMLKPTQIEKQGKLLKRIFGSLGKNAALTAPLWCDYGKNIHIGNDFYANHNLIILDAAKVEIGDNVFIAPNCTIATEGHPLNKDDRNKWLEYAMPIKIGNNVWIGAGVTILPGVTIGDGAVIGAGSIVNRDIPENCVAVGNPCKKIKDIDNDSKKA